MTIGREDAASALDAITRTRRLADERRGYAGAGDIVIAWGLVWLVCNSLSWAAPAWGYNSWPAGILLATLWSIWRGWRSGGKADWRSFASVATAIGFIALIATVTGVRGPEQGNVLISLFVAASYVTMGIWTGARFALIGLAITAAILIGWFVDREHLYLWLGLGGGGALILSGIWLRRA